MEMWRFGITEYLSKASARNLLWSTGRRTQFENLIRSQERRVWDVHISRCMTKQHLLAYAGRYIRRPPIAQNRILSISKKAIVFRYTNKQLQREEEMTLSPRRFVEKLAQHVQDHYEHSMRYFGLLAPRTKNLTDGAVCRALNHQIRPRPRRLPWATAIKKYFGVDPLLDSQGRPMSWSGRIKPQWSAPV